MNPAAGEGLSQPWTSRLPISVVQRLFPEFLEFKTAMREEAKSPTANSDIVMRSVHGDVVTLPYSLFQRLRRFHMKAVVKRENQTRTSKSTS